jgi:hypothetical protein
MSYSLAPVTARTPFTQITRDGLLLRVSFVTYGSTKRGPVTPALPEFPEIADEAV